MRYLIQFLRFDCDAFFKDKLLVVTGCGEWQDWNTKAHLGTKITTRIYKDDTDYKHKEGEQGSNRFEEVVLKVNKDLNVPINSVVVPVNAVATVYGNFNEKLSVKCDDVRIIQQKGN